MVKPKVLINLLGGITFLAFMAFLFYNPIRRRNQVEKEPKYAIGTVFKRTGSLKNGTHYHYKFHYNGREYEGYNSTNRNYEVNFGDRFIIEFSASYPDISYIHYELRVKNDQLNSPDTGWSTKPVAQ